MMELDQGKATGSPAAEKVTPAPSSEVKIKQPTRYGRYSKVIREQHENIRALESVVNSLLAEKEAEIGSLTAERDRYKAALEIIAESSADKLKAMQAKSALTNIGAAVR